MAQRGLGSRRLALVFESLRNRRGQPALALGEHLELRLSGKLRVKPVAISGHCHNRVGAELILADVAVQGLRFQGNLLVFGGRFDFQQRIARVAQVPADVVLPARGRPREPVSPV